MSHMNRVYLMGRLTRDPVLRNVGNDACVADLGLAVDEFVKSRDGQSDKRTLFVDICCWNGTARTCAEHLSKGDPILVEGKLQLDEWNDKTSGEKRTRIKVRAERVHFVGMMGPSEAGGAPGAEVPDVDRPAPAKARIPARMAPRQQEAAAPRD